MTTSSSGTRHLPGHPKLEMFMTRTSWPWYASGISHTGSSRTSRIPSSYSIRKSHTDELHAYGLPPNWIYYIEVSMKPDNTCIMFPATIKIPYVFQSLDCFWWNRRNWITLKFSFLHKWRLICNVGKYLQTSTFHVQFNQTMRTNWRVKHLVSVVANIKFL